MITVTEQNASVDIASNTILYSGWQIEPHILASGCTCCDDTITWSATKSGCTLIERDHLEEIFSVIKGQMIDAW